MPLENFVATHEPLLRLGIFFGAFVLLAVWEWRAPRRALRVAKGMRWRHNFGLFAVDIVVVRLLFPTAVVGVALWAQEQGWGLFHRVDVPYGLAVLVSIILFDLVIYAQHRLFHRVPLLWRLHRVHHADPDIDVTTGSRFHPLEILLSLVIKFAVVLILGPPLLAVILFEIILNAMALFSHSNIRLDAASDRILRRLVVTPDMHRVHHSVIPRETNSNFGFNVSLWDRLFGSYRAQPEHGHRDMDIGLNEFRDPRQITRLSGMLLMPLTSLSRRRKSPAFRGE